MATEAIRIFRGDDTDFSGGCLLRFIISAAAGTDLTGMTASFSLAGLEFAGRDISSGSFTVDLTSGQSATLPYGHLFGTLRAIDTQGRTRTISNKIPFYVTNEPVSEQGGTIHLEIPGMSGASLTIAAGYVGVSLPAEFWHSGYSGNTVPCPEISDASSFRIYRNGILQKSGQASDYIRDGLEITFTESLCPEDVLTIETYSVTSGNMPDHHNSNEENNDVCEITQKVSRFENDAGYVSLQAVLGLIKSLRADILQPADINHFRDCLEYRWIYGNIQYHDSIVELPTGGLGILKPVFHPETRRIIISVWNGEGTKPSASIRAFPQPEYFSDYRTTPEYTPLTSVDQGWNIDGMVDGIPAEYQYIVVSGYDKDSAPIEISPYKPGFTAVLETVPAWGSLILCHFDPGVGCGNPFTLEEITEMSGIPSETAYAMGYERVL